MNACIEKGAAIALTDGFDWRVNLSDRQNTVLHCRSCLSFIGSINDHIELSEAYNSSHKTKYRDYLKNFKSKVRQREVGDEINSSICLCSLTCECLYCSQGCMEVDSWRHLHVLSNKQIRSEISQFNRLTESIPKANSFQMALNVSLKIIERLSKTCDKQVETYEDLETSLLTLDRLIKSFQDRFPVEKGADSLTFDCDFREGGGDSDSIHPKAVYVSDSYVLMSLIALLTIKSSIVSDDSCSVPLDHIRRRTTEVFSLSVWASIIAITTVHTIEINRRSPLEALIVTLPNLPSTQDRIRYYKQFHHLIKKLTCESSDDSEAIGDASISDLLSVDRKLGLLALSLESQSSSSSSHNSGANIFTRPLFNPLATFMLNTFVLSDRFSSLPRVCCPSAILDYSPGSEELSLFALRHIPITRNILSNHEGAAHRRRSEVVSIDSAASFANKCAKEFCIRCSYFTRIKSSLLNKSRSDQAVMLSSDRVRVASSLEISSLEAKIAIDSLMVARPSTGSDKDSSLDDDTSGNNDNEYFNSCNDDNYAAATCSASEDISSDPDCAMTNQLFAIKLYSQYLSLMTKWHSGQSPSQRCLRESCVACSFWGVFSDVLQSLAALLLDSHTLGDYGFKSDLSESNTSFLDKSSWLYAYLLYEKSLGIIPSNELANMPTLTEIKAKLQAYSSYTIYHLNNDESDQLNHNSLQPSKLFTLSPLSSSNAPLCLQNSKSKSYKDILPAVYVADSIVTNNDCLDLIRTSESVALARRQADGSDGWTSSRHYAFPTTDIPVHSDRSLLASFNHIMSDNAAFLLASQFYHQINPDAKSKSTAGTYFVIHDAFIVKYEHSEVIESDIVTAALSRGKGKLLRRYLPLHMDQSTHSFVLALNSSRSDEEANRERKRKRGDIDDLPKEKESLDGKLLCGEVFSTDSNKAGEPTGSYSEKGLELGLGLDSSHYSSESFSGGGTFIADIEASLKPQAGGMLSFSGDVLHGGDPIYSGKRYIVAAFLMACSTDSHAYQSYIKPKECKPENSSDAEAISKEETLISFLREVFEAAEQTPRLLLKKSINQITPVSKSNALEKEKSESLESVDGSGSNTSSSNTFSFGFF